jgi:hypothetical protein
MAQHVAHEDQRLTVVEVSANRPFVGRIGSGVGHDRSGVAGNQ